MKLKRKPVNKKASVHNFRHKAGKTKAANVAPNPMRGGFRL